MNINPSKACAISTERKEAKMLTTGFAAPWLEFEKLVGFRPLIHGPTIDNLLKEWNTMGSAFVEKLTFPAPDTSVATEDRILDGGLKIRIYTPRGYSTGSKPIGLYIHGGGWAMGGLETDDSTCRAISKSVSVVLVSVDYRLAPQDKYPAGLDDCIRVFKWALENATSLGGTSEQVFIAGASAGGGSTFAVALKIVDEGNGDLLAGLVSQVPCIIHPDVVPKNLRGRYTSYDEHEEHTVNTKSAMLTFWKIYGAPVGDIYANPILHPKLKDLPKVYITSCGQDTLRDDARLMRDALMQAGVPVRYDEFDGYPHYFWTFPAPSLEGPARDYLRKLEQGVKYVLSSSANM